MKRQRGVNAHGHAPKVEEVGMGKKKTKKEAEQIAGEKVVVGEERSSSKELESREASSSSWEDHECMAAAFLGVGGGVVVDEQMSWSSTWFPSWDMDFMGDAFSALYTDVVWFDDIWNLNSQIPIPPTPTIPLDTI